jgi:Cerato-platanin
MDSIGGAAAIKSWNSPNCGTCWQLTYTNDKGKSTSINLLAVDVSDDGFNVSLEAMNALTNNLATELGRIDVQSVQVDASTCGL